MPKRFTATEKWDDPWFFDLSDRSRIAWIYLLDKCNHAGIWVANWKLAEFYLRSPLDISAFGDRVVRLREDKYFIPKFIEFQYGTLSEFNRAHVSVIGVLKREGVENKVLISPLRGAKDKDKDKAKDKDKESSIGFENFWKAYPRRVGRSAALKAWDKISPEPELVQIILKAIESHRNCEQWRSQGGKFIPHPSTWINQKRWEDEVSLSTGKIVGGAASVPGKYAHLGKENEPAS